MTDQENLYGAFSDNDFQVAARECTHAHVREREGVGNSHKLLYFNMFFKLIICQAHN